MFHIVWWTKEEHLSQGLPLSPPPHTHVITTDASGDGWGGVLADLWTFNGVWNNMQRTWHINRLEFQAVELTLHKFVSQLRNSTVLVRSDNMTTCAYINCQGGTWSPDVCLQAWNLFHWCLAPEITFRAFYIPGLVNLHPDRLSRHQARSHQSIIYQVDQREWSLLQSIADALFVLLGEPVIDLFASHSNATLKLFCTLQGSQGEVW